MRVYTVKDLMTELQIGKPAATKIMKSHGFQIGYSKLSPYRITEEQLAEWASDKRKERDESLRNI